MANGYFDNFWSQPNIQQAYAQQLNQPRFGYPQMYQPTNLMPQPQPPQTVGERLIFVQTLDDISKVQVPASASLWVMATNDNVIARVEADEMGLIKSRKFCSLTAIDPETFSKQSVQPQLNPNDYVTRAEYEELINSLKPKKPLKKEAVTVDE